MRPKCPIEPEGIHCYLLSNPSVCEFCGLLFTYMGTEELQESDEEMDFPPGE
jgi:hypothetical protein